MEKGVVFHCIYDWKNNSYKACLMLGPLDGHGSGSKNRNKEPWGYLLVIVQVYKNHFWGESLYMKFTQA